ncbi:MAG: hypothetical protein R3A51_10785 [Nannocystaceae bacterium]
MADASRTSRTRWLFVAIVALGLGVAVWWITARAPEAPPAPEAERADLSGTARGIVEISVEDPESFWRDAGYIRMIPPARLPSTSPVLEQIEIWIKIPEGGVITTEYLPDQKRHTLRYPQGTHADRIEFLGHGPRRQIADVRGTVFGPDGRERFRVLRPEQAQPNARLRGFEWDRGDPEQQAEVTRRMLEFLATTEQVKNMKPTQREAFERRFRGINQCAPCHTPRLAEAETLHAKGPVHRATDASGLYTIETVLRDRAPIEDYRRHDLNLKDPAITHRCGDAPALPGAHASAPPQCPDRGVPIAIFDLAASLAEGEPRARDLCRARAYLLERLDEAGLNAFADALTPCAEVELD